MRTLLNMFYLTSFYAHLRHLTAAAQRRGLSGEVKIGSMNAVLRGGGREVEFLAQFMVRNPDGSRTYSMEYRDDALGFAGWLPYFNKRWVEAYDKLAFKQRCAALGLLTPRWSVGQVDAGLGDFVVKNARGSFGQAVRGPFTAAQAGSVDFQPGDFAERFVAGQVGKAWYWNDTVVMLELREPTTVTGDGLATVAQLVQRVRRQSDVTTITDWFRYRGLNWSDVPPAGQLVAVDFKYGSPFGRVEMESANRLQDPACADLLAQLRQWAPVFLSWVPEQIRTNVLFTVDFVLPPDGRARLLEMNCNPTVPPEAYDLIVGAAFDGVAPADEQGAAPRAPAAFAAWSEASAPPFRQVPPPSAPTPVPTA
jgi:hypothetical protein